MYHCMTSASLSLNAVVSARHTHAPCHLSHSTSVKRRISNLIRFSFCIVTIRITGVPADARSLLGVCKANSEPQYAVIPWTLLVYVQADIQFNTSLASFPEYRVAHPKKVRHLTLCNDRHCLSVWH